MTIVYECYGQKHTELGVQNVVRYARLLFALNCLMVFCSLYLGGILSRH